MSGTRVIVVPVKLEDRADGGLRVSSDRLPGLILSGADKDTVCDQIIVAIKAIFDHAGFSVIVRPAQDIREVLKQCSPRDVDLHISEFVVELQQAA